MCDYTNILQIIYKYYPQNCEYLTNLYKKSEEYLQYENIVNNSELRENLHDKFLQVLKSVFTDYYINIWSNKDYPSLHFSVLLHKNQPILDDDEELLDALNGIRLDLEIYFSFLSNYFYTFIIKTSKSMESSDWQFSLQDEEYLIKNEIYSLTNACKTLGYQKLDYHTAHTIVPNVETELLYEGEVKIFNCLFTDLEKMF